MVSVVLFLLGVYGTTWTLCLTLRAAAGAGSSGAVYAFFFGTVWAPTVLAILLAALIGGRRDIADLVSRALTVPRRAAWLAVAAAVPFVIISLAVLAARARGDVAAPPPLSAWPLIVGLQVATGATGEELGWRAFLLPRLSQRFGFTRGASLSAALWSGWHVAGAYFPGTALQVAPIVPFTGHVLASILAHLSLNVTLALVGVSFASALFWWVAVLATAAVVGLLAFRAWPANTALQPTALRAAAEPQR
jgi:membrane protease YdiL (CAAX protease family)